MMIDVIGLVVVLAFYAVVLVSGILATRWFKKHRLEGTTEGREVTLVAGRKLGGCIGIFTMTATTVGGGFVNGTAESMATMGLAWTLAPFGICIGIIIGGLVFARPMREKRYLTMFDPFQQKFGHTMVALLYLAAICGDIFWAASVLAALGTSLSVIINIDMMIAVIASALVTVVYVMFGQVVSVAYTDVLQLIFITVGLVLALPFVMTHPALEPIGDHKDTWLGSIQPRQAALWADLLITMTFGTIPWQTYFQRVLSVKSVRQAQVLSVASSVGVFLLAVPPALVGIAAASTDWNQTARGVSPLESGQAALVVPLTLQYMTPRAVALIGLGAIAAAVMSSVDSAVLSSASVFTHNIYKMVLRTKASEHELLWIQRCSVLIVGALATVLAISVTSIYGMFILAADIVFVIMFPQLFAVIFIHQSNAYGSLLGYFVGLFLRFSAGEPLLSLPALLRYPGYDYTMEEQLFPFRTFAMLVSLLCIVTISYLTRYIFLNSKVPLNCDFFGCFKNGTEIPLEISTPLENHSQDNLLTLSDSGCILQNYKCSANGNSDFRSPDLSKSADHHTGQSGATQNGYCKEEFSKSSSETNCGTVSVARM